MPPTGQAHRPVDGRHPARTGRPRRPSTSSASARRATFGPDDIVAFVAVDLLWLDGESLLDVPLLERKRLLEAVARRVEPRPPRRRSSGRRSSTWVSSWRALGFAGLTYKAANSRYRPGGVKDDWATSAMPRA